MPAEEARATAAVHPTEGEEGPTEEAEGMAEAEEATGEGEGWAVADLRTRDWEGDCTPSTLLGRLR